MTGSWFSFFFPHISKVPYPKQYLDVRKAELLEDGFEVLESGEAHQPIRFLTWARLFGLQES